MGDSQRGIDGIESRTSTTGVDSTAYIEVRERTLLILAGNRLYLVVASWPPSNDFALSISQLLRSFELRLP